MSKEDFPINIDTLNEFIVINKRIWHDTYKSNRGCILINFSMVRMQIPWILPKILHAKGLQEKTGYRIIALTWNENEELMRFFESFEVEHVALNSLCRKNILYALFSVVRTGSFILFNGKGENLKKMKVGKINVGKNIYEDILRTSSLSTLKTCRSKMSIKKIFHLLLSFYSVKKLIKKNAIKYAITDDMAYHEGMFIKLFINEGMVVHACSNVALKRVQLHQDGEVVRHTWCNPEEIREFISKVQDKELSWVDNYLNERFQGKNGRDIDRQAFANKKVLSKEEFIREYSIDPTRKTVVIMAHTFTDAIFNYGDYYFRDYYDWTEKTLFLASLNKNVNWILKPHPTRASYNESIDSIEDMFAKYKKDNMFILSDDVSSESIKNIADIIITIGGNAGAEYSCFGIPAIVVGKPYYSGQGYTIEPNSYEEYKETLFNIGRIERLTEEEIVKAKKVFLYKNMPNTIDENYKDEFSLLVNKEYKEMCDKLLHQYFSNNEGTESYNTKFLQKLINYIKDNDIKKTEYYCRSEC